MLGILDKLDFVKGQLSQLPDARIAQPHGVDGFGSVWALLSVVALLVVRVRAAPATCQAVCRSADFAAVSLASLRLLPLL